MPLYLTFKKPADHAVFDSALSSALTDVLSETSLIPEISYTIFGTKLVKITNTGSLGKSYEIPIQIEGGFLTLSIPELITKQFRQSGKAAFKAQLQGVGLTSLGMGSSPMDQRPVPLSTSGSPGAALWDSDSLEVPSELAGKSGMGGGYRKQNRRKHRKSHRKNRNNRKTRRN
jgi:hypothetical protein